MKLEPVYLVAPEPAPKSMPTRRAFLIAAACGLGGACAGVAGGYALAAGRNNPDAAQRDADVQWAIEMLQQHTDAELLESFAGLLGVIGEHAEVRDLHVGLRRLARVVIAGPDRPERRLQLTSMAGLMDRPDFADCANTLAEVRRALR